MTFLYSSCMGGVGDGVVLVLHVALLLALLLRSVAVRFREADRMLAESPCDYKFINLTSR